MNQLFGLQHRRKHHLPKALPQGRDATAPTRRSFTNVRLGIRALACFFTATTRSWSNLSGTCPLTGSARAKGQTAPTSEGGMVRAV